MTAYEDVRDAIARMAHGQRGVLTSDIIVALEETGGSSGGRKLVPYTAAALDAFRHALLPWLDDLASSHPAIAGGKSYWAISPAAGVTIERGTPEKLPHIVSFLNRNLAARQFAPVYRESDFPNGRFKGLQPKDFFLAIRDGRIAGTMAVWDQAAYRQTHVERYSSLLTIARPFYNAAAYVSPVKRLPDPGARIPYVYLACLATVNDDVSVFRHLLHAVHDAIRGGPWHYAIAGLHERDPRARTLLALRHILAAGRLFVVHYADEAPMLDTVSTRVPYLEAGCL